MNLLLLHLRMLLFLFNHYSFFRINQFFLHNSLNLQQYVMEQVLRHLSHNSQHMPLIIISYTMTNLVEQLIVYL